LVSSSKKYASSRLTPQWSRWGQIRFTASSDQFVRTASTAGIFVDGLEAIGPEAPYNARRIFGLSSRGLPLRAEHSEEMFERARSVRIKTPAE
jgi:hypothetical protein